MNIKQHNYKGERKVERINAKKRSELNDNKSHKKRFLMKNSLSKVLLAVVVFGLSAASVNARETKKLQVLVNPLDPTWSYTVFTATGIAVDNPLAVRSIGGNYLINGLVYPGGTIKKNQATYAVDKHGNALNASNSLGMWFCFGKMLNTLDFAHLPARGTLLELCEHHIQFNENCEGDVNDFYALGNTIMGIAGFNTPLLVGNFGIVGGTGCNGKEAAYVA